MKSYNPHKISGVLAALCLMTGTAAPAQTTAPATPVAPVPQTVPGTAAPATATTVEPKDFIRQAYLANEFGILAGQLALKDAQSANAKDAARQVVADGMKLRQDMVTAIQNSSSDMHFDQAWDDHYKQELAELKSAKGAEFDQKYLAIQSEITAQSAGMFKDYASAGTDTAVKSFAANSVPVLQSDAEKLKTAQPGRAA